MEFNELLRREDINPERVIALRHRPSEPSPSRALPWLAAERPDVYNAYQRTQAEKLTKSLRGLVGSGHVASFLARGPGRALFVGLYSVEGVGSLSTAEYWAVPENQELRELGWWVPGSGRATAGSTWG